MSRAAESLILYGGGFIILYSILKSWGVIQSTSSVTQMTCHHNWNPLTNDEINTLKIR